jgi:hypothetical protein
LGLELRGRSSLLPYDRFGTSPVIGAERAVKVAMAAKLINKFTNGVNFIDIPKENNLGIESSILRAIKATLEVNKGGVSGRTKPAHRPLFYRHGVAVNFRASN